MHSLHSKITILTLCMTTIAVVIVTMVSVFFIRNNERRKSDQLLLLLCQTGERNLDLFFNSVQNSMVKVSNFTAQDLEGIDELGTEELEGHIERVNKYFGEIADKTQGVLTYYYRIDPEVSDTVKGFWYTNLNNEGFEEHEVTDITQYDTSDTSKLVWFTVPKHTGEAVWLPPYITDNLDVRVISYNIPIYWRGKFIGVAGIELDYTSMAELVDSIRLYDNGYAFVIDEKGNLFFHPFIDVAELNENTLPEIPKGLVSNSTFIRYTFEGIEKQGVWLSLANGMRLNVVVPVSETEGSWQKLVKEIIVISTLILLLLSSFILLYTRRITKPLEELTEATEELGKGNYDFTLNYDGDDEVGRLTRTFKLLSSHMKVHINELNNQVYIDPLTSVKNKGAFSNYLAHLQERMDADPERLHFAVGVFDCDNLKMINDLYGHDKGDLYLKNACQLICKIFKSSPVFRIGGDEFSVIMQNNDYNNREELTEKFKAAMKATAVVSTNSWDQVHVAMGLATYDPMTDPAVIDVVRRADKYMYANKRARKKGRS